MVEVRVLEALGKPLDVPLVYEVNQLFPFSVVIPII